MPSPRKSNKGTMGMGTTGVVGSTTSGTAAHRRPRKRAGSTAGTEHRFGHEGVTVDAVIDKWLTNGVIAADEQPQARKYLGLALISFGL